MGNDIGCVDSECVENAKRISDRVLQGVCGHFLRAIGAPESTLVRCDGAEAVPDKEWNLVAPKIRRVRPPMQQEHRPTAAVVFNMKGNAIARNMMLRVARRRWTCWNRQAVAFTTFANRYLCQGSSGGQYAAKPGKERATRIQGFSFTVTVHMPFFLSASDSSCMPFNHSALPLNATPRRVVLLMSQVFSAPGSLEKLSATSRGDDPIAHF